MRKWTCVAMATAAMLFGTESAKAQSSNSVGIFGGITSSHTDATPDKTAEFYGITGQYDPVRFAGLKLTLGSGTLTGGEGNSTDMHYTNKFLQADLIVKFMPVRIFENSLSRFPAYHYVSNLYIGGGVGMLRSNTKINYLNSSLFNWQGDYMGSDIIFPIEAGIEIPIYSVLKESGVSINLGYRTHYMRTDQMDGYDPNVPTNKQKDIYNAFILGINYRF